MSLGAWNPRPLSTSYWIQMWTEHESVGNWEGNEWIHRQGGRNHRMENHVLTAVIATAGSILIWMAFIIRVSGDVITSVLSIFLSGCDIWSTWAGNFTFLLHADIYWQESIPVRCESPACQLNVLHNEKVWTCWGGAGPGWGTGVPVQWVQVEQVWTCSRRGQTRLKTLPSHNFVGRR